MISNIFSDCVFHSIRSPGNKIGKDNYHENIESPSECQTLCKKYNASCEYFTYHERKCMLKTVDAKWNLLHRNGSLTGSRDCDLTEKYGKV